MLAAIGGAFAAGLYGRRASIELQAIAYSSYGRMILSVRPSVRAVGVLRLRFELEEGAWIRGTEQLWSNGELVDGLYWDATAVLGQSFVEGGETLRSTTLVDVGLPPGGLAGWRVSFGISVARYRPNQGSWQWGDQVFVPVPADRRRIVQRTRRR